MRWIVRAPGWTVLLGAAACAEGAVEPFPVEVVPSCAAVQSIDLEVGEAALLNPGDSACIGIDRAGKYALAFLDVAAIEAWRSGEGTDFFPTDTFEVAAALPGPDTVLVATALRSATDHRRLAIPVPPSDVRIAPAECENWAEVYCRDRPWEVGDRFEGPVAQGTATAEVVAVVGQFVVANWVSELSLMAPALPTIRSVFEEAGAEVVPLLRRTLADDFVTTSAGSGQLVVIVRDASLSLAYSRPSETTSSSFIVLSINPSLEEEIGQVFAVGVLAHELAHAWQFRHIYSGMPDEGAWLPQWGIEGGADFLEVEYLRRRFGVELEPNAPARGSGRINEPVDVYWHQLHRGDGDIEAGYGQTEPLLRDLLIRSVRAGANPEDALSELLRGGTEGWFGNNGRGWDPPGLAARLQPWLGPDWDPVEGILTYTLSQALDDRVSSEVFFDATTSEAWRTVGSKGFGPAGWVTAGPVAVRRRAGSTGWYQVVVTDSAAARLIVRSTSEGYGQPFFTNLRPTVRWMIARME